MSANVAKTTLIEPARLRELSRRSDRKGLARLALHGVMIVLGGGLIALAWNGVWLLPALFLHGLTLVSLFAVVHESIHYTAFKTRRLNEIVAWLAGLPIMLNATLYRQFHYAHHRYCQNPARDPELTPPPPTTVAEYLWRVSGIPYWLGRLRQNATIALGRLDGLDYLPQSARAAVLRSTRGYWLVYLTVAAISLAAQSTAAVWYWLLPTLLAQPLLRLYLLSEHTGCSNDDNGLTNTRTTLANAPLRLLMWNMPYHAEHHLFPQLPFHALPKAHPLIRDRLAHIAPSYRATQRSIWRGLGRRRRVAAHGR